MKKLVNVVMILCFSVPAFSQNYREEVKEGNKAYENGKYTDAEVAYKKAAKDKQASVESTYNLGNTLFKQERYKEAIESFQEAISMTDDAKIKAEAYHNLGNSYAKDEKLKEAVEAYQQALRLNPKDEETRYNLAKSIRKMKQQEQQQQQQKKDQKKDDQKKDEKDKKDDQDKKDQNKNDKGDQDEKKNDKQDKGDPNKPDEGKDEKDKKQAKTQKGDISREDAKRLLEALARKEEALQKKMNQEKIKVKAVQTEKDW